MKLKGIIAFAIVLNLCSAYGEEFRKTYVIAEGGQIVIGNPMGNISVAGYSGKEIEIVASKKGPDKGSLEVQDNSFGNRVEIYPKFDQFVRGNASIDFEIRIPQDTNFSLMPSTFSGKIDILRTSGHLMAKSIRGDIEIKSVHGSVNASSLSGNVTVELDSPAIHNNMRLSSTSGNISIQAPASIQALIDISTANGWLKTNFPIEVEEMRYGPGKAAHAKLGTGNTVLHIRSIYGNVSFTHK